MKPAHLTCLFWGRLEHGQYNHPDCGVVMMNAGEARVPVTVPLPAICPCECSVCKRAWWKAHRPRIEDGNVRDDQSADKTAAENHHDDQWLALTTDILEAMRRDGMNLSDPKVESAIRKVVEYCVETAYQLHLRQRREEIVVEMVERLIHKNEKKQGNN
jgi:hypothetical protein